MCPTIWPFNTPVYLHVVATITAKRVIKPPLKRSTHEHTPMIQNYENIKDSASELSQASKI
jgi:hypothetical protein